MSAMPEPGYVHGGTDPREVARLEKQAGFTASLTFPHFEVAPGQRVLDLATGTGAMAARLRAAFPGARVVGVDLSAAQLAASRANHPELAVARADGARLPFADATFDRVHCSWLLEHLVDPRPVLREVRRVLRPGGWCQFVEVDNESFGTTPRSEEVEAAMRALNLAQQRGGGDPFIGQRLHRHFAAAGFRRFTVEPLALRGHAGDRRFFQAFIDEFAEIFEGLDEALGPAMAPTLRAAAARLRALIELPGGRMQYTARLAKGWR